MSRRRREPRVRREAPAAGRRLETIEGRNPVLAALEAGDRVQRLLLDQGVRPDPKLEALLLRAGERGVAVERVARAVLDERTEGRPHNGVVALARPLPSPTLAQVIEDIAATGEDDPLLLLLDEVQYEQNLGAILRTADAAGASAVVIPRRRGARLSPVSQRIAMGAAEHVPVVRCAILEAMALLRREGYRLIGADEDGSVAHHDADLTGAAGLVLGGEDKGLTPPVRGRCDALVRVPMTGHVPSLNVSVTAGILLFERRRQIASLSKNRP